ncbi:MAG TPA: DUF1595 domain-containing protein [Bryobacteraceae bacterium]|nr:DUF1595 domain-containing protein [Bryobacteraceae bacterium]
MKFPSAEVVHCGYHASATRFLNANGGAGCRGVATAGDDGTAIAGYRAKAYIELFRAAQQQGETYEAAVLYALRGVLVSPNFLFRVEPPNPTAAPRPMGQFSMASRLSCFLWAACRTNRRCGRRRHGQAIPGERSRACGRGWNRNGRRSGNSHHPRRRNGTGWRRRIGLGR